jgi:hypothetical protein
MLETRTGLLCQLDGAYVSYFEVYVSEIVRPLSLARSRLGPGSNRKSALPTFGRQAHAVNDQAAEVGTGCKAVGTK